jgi:hypothetical protein
MDDVLTGAGFLIHRLEDLVDYLVRYPLTGVVVGGSIVLFLWWLVKK